MKTAWYELTIGELARVVGAVREYVECRGDLVSQSVGLDRDGEGCV